MTNPRRVFEALTGRMNVVNFRTLTFVLLPLVSVVIAALTVFQILEGERLNSEIAKRTELRNAAQFVFVLTQGAESAQRGYLLTGKTKYLQPYNVSVPRMPEALARLQRAAQDAPDGTNVELIVSDVHIKFQELQNTIEMKRNGRTGDAIDLMASGLGSDMMDEIRDATRPIVTLEQKRIDELAVYRANSLRQTVVVVVMLVSALVLFLALGVIATLAGLRERDRSVRALAEAKFAADDANRAKSEFLASMSHELRTPLNAILGFSEMIETQVFGPIGPGKYLEYAKHIHDSGAHLLDLINDVLDLSKISAGKMELHESDVALPALLDEALSLVKGRAVGVNLREQRNPGLPHIWADKRLLKQVLINLLSNAIKFTPSGGAVTIGAEVTALGIFIHVTDTGIGMSAAQIEKAMSPYGQIDSKIAREHKGTGLGLPICKSLAELHGGTLEVASQPNVGTTMTVALPVSRVMRGTAKSTQRLAS